MKRVEPDPRRVRIQVTAIAPGGKTVPGSSLSMVVYETTPADVMAIIEAAMEKAEDKS